MNARRPIVTSTTRSRKKYRVLRTRGPASRYAEVLGDLARPVYIVTSALPYRCQFTNTPELRFRAVLTEGGAKRVELTRT